MILAIDIGNTRIKWGKFSLSQGMVSSGFFSTKEFTKLSDLQAVELAVVSSVVPSLTEKVLSQLENIRTHLVDAQSPWSFSLAVENPETLGSDRLCNLQALTNLPGAVLVIDMGTAIKLDLLEGRERKVFVGGCIAPGLSSSFQNLLAKTEKLKDVDLSVRSPVVGYNTETAIRSGVVQGFASLVDGMIAKFVEERKIEKVVQTVLTGGDAKLVKNSLRFVSQVREHLSLEGLYELGKKL
ncbi:MAG: type III pantothenate kinase [Oligoflexia bacterium]|nr:type III pantothenate kinase [Oligoflexia bacterium]